MDGAFCKSSEYFWLCFLAKVILRNSRNESPSHERMDVLGDRAQPEISDTDACQELLLLK